jgi:hypothetical protein
MYLAYQLIDNIRLKKQSYLFSLHQGYLLKKCYALNMLATLLRHQEFPILDYYIIDFQYIVLHFS